jgi:hypothetical protein
MIPPGAMSSIRTRVIENQILSQIRDGSFAVDPNSKNQADFPTNITDEWSNPFKVQVVTNVWFQQITATVTSAGPDGIDGTTDDFKKFLEIVPQSVIAPTAGAPETPTN